MREGEQRDFARRLRRNLTDAEQCLWHSLRNRALMGCKFRRQHPVGPYIADFACIEAGLIVELDGGQHANSNTDAARTACLASCGYRVLRFWNNEALPQAEAVLAVIHDAPARRPALTPTPLPPAGEGLDRLGFTPSTLSPAGEGLDRPALTPTPLPPAGEGLEAPATT